LILDDDLLRDIFAVELPQTDDATLQCAINLPRLRKLSLSGSQVTDATLERLKGLTKLRWLHLKVTAITDAGLERLSGMTDLQELDLSATKVTDAGLRHLKLLAHLRFVQLNATKVTGDAAVRFRQAMPGCKTGGAEDHQDRGAKLECRAALENRHRVDCGRV
jgi:hypothetical protein